MPETCGQSARLQEADGAAGRSSLRCFGRQFLQSRNAPGADECSKSRPTVAPGPSATSLRARPGWSQATAAARRLFRASRDNARHVHESRLARHREPARPPPRHARAGAHPQGGVQPHPPGRVHAAAGREAGRLPRRAQSRFRGPPRPARPGAAAKAGLGRAPEPLDRAGADGQRARAPRRRRHRPERAAADARTQRRARRARRLPARRPLDAPDQPRAGAVGGGLARAGAVPRAGRRRRRLGFLPQRRRPGAGGRARFDDRLPACGRAGRPPRIAARTQPRRQARPPRVAVAAPAVGVRHTAAAGRTEGRVHARARPLGAPGHRARNAGRAERRTRVPGLPRHVPEGAPPAAPRHALRRPAEQRQDPCRVRAPRAGDGRRLPRAAATARTRRPRPAGRTRRADLAADRRRKRAGRERAHRLEHDRDGRYQQADRRGGDRRSADDLRPIAWLGLDAGDRRGAGQRAHRHLLGLCGAGDREPARPVRRALHGEALRAQAACAVARAPGADRGADVGRRGGRVQPPRRAHAARPDRRRRPPGLGDLWRAAARGEAPRGRALRER